MHDQRSFVACQPTGYHREEVTVPYEIWLIDEIVGAEVDLEHPVEPTETERAVLALLPPQDTRDHTVHRLANAWRDHHAGTLVLYDGYEVLLFVRVVA